MRTVTTSSLPCHSPVTTWGQSPHRHCPVTAQWLHEDSHHIVTALSQHSDYMRTVTTSSLPCYSPVTTWGQSPHRHCPVTAQWLHEDICSVTDVIKLNNNYTANFFSITWLYCRVAVNVTLTSRCWKPFWTYQYGHLNNVTTPAASYTGLTLQRHCMGNTVAV